MTNLKRIIDEKGVQQRWLAEQIGVTEVSMSRYVSGERIPKAPLAIRIADVLGVDVKDLYGGEPEKRTEERTETHELFGNSEQLPSAQPKHDISKANFLCPICGAEMEVAVSGWEGEG